MIQFVIAALEMSDFPLAAFGLIMFADLVLDIAYVTQGKRRPVENGLSQS